MTDTLNITVIEDDDDARRGLTKILKLDDHRVAAFSTVASAVRNGFADVDLILMDRKLPDGMAEDLLPRLRLLANEADFVVITGYSDMHATIAALREGVYDYLIKPIDPTALRASIKRLAQRRAMEHELYRQRRFAETLLETAEAIVLVLDTRGRVLRANRFLLELTGYSLAEVDGKDWFQLFIPPNEQEPIRQIFVDTVAQVDTRGIVNPILTKARVLKHIRWSNSTLRDASGTTTAVLAVGLDISDLVETQEEMLKNARLVTIGETVTGLAHESRNALQRMQNAVDLLKISLRNPTNLHDLEKIERSGQHIRGLLEEVRNYAAPIQLMIEDRLLPEVWRRAWDSVSHRMKNRCVHFREQLSENVSQANLMTRLDAERLEQVFRNLFENSLDSCDEELTISVTCNLSEGSLTTLIHDDGPGVPSSHRDKLFDAFATSKPKGTGLGLSISKRIAEAHGGTLRLIPSERGAEFELVLPRWKRRRSE